MTKQRGYKPQKSVRTINYYQPVRPHQHSMLSHGWYRQMITTAEIDNLSVV